MGRIQEREAARREKNALSELCKVQRKFMPDLFELFEKTADPRNPCYEMYAARYYMKMGSVIYNYVSTEAQYDSKLESDFGFGWSTDPYL